MKKESLLKDFFYTLLTLGFYNFYVQIRQIIDFNEINGRDKYSFIKTIIFSALTLGLYFCYHEYVLTVDLYEKMTGKRERKKLLWIIPVTFFGIWPAVDSYQQVILNNIAEEKEDISHDDCIRLIIIGLLYFVLILGLIIFGESSFGNLFL